MHDYHAFDDRTPEPRLPAHLSTLAWLLAHLVADIAVRLCAPVRRAARVRGSR